MRLLTQTSSDGVSEHLFTLDGIPGVLWSPAGAAGRQPLILLAHGGGQHKQAPGMQARARRLLTARGFAVAALDAPRHRRPPRTAHGRQVPAGPPGTDA